MFAKFEPLILSLRDIRRAFDAIAAIELFAKDDRQPCEADRVLGTGHSSKKPLKCAFS